jgi:hypothetical protein
MAATKDEAVFGPFILDEEVKAAFIATLKEWLPTYLAVIERRVGLEPKSLPLPRAWVVNDDGNLDKRPQDQLPTVVVMMPGSGEVKPVRDGRGVYRAGYVVNVAVIVSAGGEDEQANTSRLAERYRAAVALILLHHGSLGGFAEGLLWRGWRTDDLKPQEEQSQAAGTNVCEVLVKGIAQHGVGLKEPLEEPYEETDLPTITEVDVDIEPEGL